MKLLIVFLFSNLAFAQAPLVGNPGEFNSDVLKHEGRLVTVQLVMGEPIRIFVVGKEEAKLDLSQMKLSVRRLKPYPESQLVTDQLSNSYTISKSSDLKEGTELELTTEIKNKKETHRFKLKNRTP